MAEAFLFFDFVGILVVGGLWIWLYLKLARRLRAREAPPTGNARRNGMDHFFSLVRLMVLSEDRRLQDKAISRLCLLIKFLTVVLALLFVGLVFGPFFLGGEEPPS